MERAIELVNYTAVDREFFEPYGRRSVDEKDFIESLKRTIPANWTLHRSGIWMQCMPPSAKLPPQGWKIHVSSVPETARVVLMITAAALVARGTAFKFAADARMLAALNGKRWPRSGSGKFITVYPRDSDDFRRIIDDLHAILSGYVGPYVLTDRRYRDSGVLFYRYGGIQGESRMSAGGRPEWMLRRPDGGYEPDERLPRFRVPDWLRDPFLDDARDASAPAAPAAGLRDGRFRIVRAVTFSSAGGVYIADDMESGKRVIIKEARPHIGGKVTAIAMLRKEFRLLRRMALLGTTPAPVAFFIEWEHAYLVEEYIEGTTLRAWLGSRYPWLKARPTRADSAAFLRAVHAVFSALAQALADVHALGISLGDFSFHNCMVDNSQRVRLIDLEAAVEHGLDVALDLRTPGFASPSPERSDLAAARAEDTYAFGANLFAAMTPVNALLPLDATAAARFAAQMCSDMGYPDALCHVIVSLLDSDPARRPSPTSAMASMGALLDALPDDGQPVALCTAPLPAVPDVADELFAYIGRRALDARPDRYVPAAAEVFESHPWGVAHGAAGVLHAFQRGGRTLPAGLLDYVLHGVRQSRDRGSSLMHGDAGVAWVLFDAGLTDVAASLLRDKPADAAIRRHAGLHDGLAGWGLGQLKAWHETAETGFLERAVQAADELLLTAASCDDMLHWEAGASIPVGLGHGAAGVALFLLHVAGVTRDQRFSHAARQALAYDVAQRMSTPDGLATWPRVAGGGAYFPYLRQGTAGILAVAARFHVLTGDETYRDLVVSFDADIMRRHVIVPGLFHGLAGLGETLLDLAAFVPDRASVYTEAARSVAIGIQPFLLRRDGGLAVPGAELLRISCDLATGNAGVAAFHDRLHRGGQASFLLDEYMPALQVPQSAAPMLRTAA